MVSQLEMKAYHRIDQMAAALMKIESHLDRIATVAEKLSEAATGDGVESEHH